jgi:hypothetical protein
MAQKLVIEKITERTNLLDKFFRHVLKRKRKSRFNSDQLNILYENLCFNYIKNQKQNRNKFDYLHFEKNGRKEMDNDDESNFQNGTSEIMIETESDDESVYYSCSEGEDEENKGQILDEQEENVISHNVGNQIMEDGNIDMKFDMEEADLLLQALNECGIDLQTTEQQVS